MFHISLWKLRNELKAVALTGEIKKLWKFYDSRISALYQTNIPTVTSNNSLKYCEKRHSTMDGGLLLRTLNMTDL